MATLKANYGNIGFLNSQDTIVRITAELRELV